MAKITIRGARESAGYTQEEIAKQLGVSRKTYAKWEKNVTQISIAYLCLFCKITGFSEDEIFIP